MEEKSGKPREVLGLVRGPRRAVLACLCAARDVVGSFGGAEFQGG